MMQLQLAAGAGEVLVDVVDRSQTDENLTRHVEMSNIPES
jgi:hypothetical protein